jgi:pimeloyl-ACP methyl ester carboxylesterase
MFSIGRAGVRVGSVVTPERTARHVAQQFFTTMRAAPERRRFRAEAPHVASVQLADGPVVSYTWGDTERAPTVLLVHGWNGWAQQLERFVEPLRAQGYAVVAFDHVAHGASIGAQASLPIMVRSVRAMLQRLRQPAGAIAHSLGAAAVAGVMVSDPHLVPAAVLIAPPTDPRPYLRLVARGLGAPDTLLESVQREAETTVGVPFASLVVDESFARQIEQPLLIVHDVNDAEVAISNGRIYAQAPQARMLATDGLGHRRIISDPHVVQSGVQFLIEWSKAAAPEVEVAAKVFMPTVKSSDGREHREMLTDFGAMC